MIENKPKINEKELENQKGKTIWVVRYTDTENELSYNELVTDDLFLAICYIKQQMDIGLYELKKYWRKFRKNTRYLDWRNNSALRPEYCGGYFIEEHELNKSFLSKINNRKIEQL